MRLSDLVTLMQKLQSSHCDKVWILASHYPYETFGEFLALLLKDKNPQILQDKTGVEESILLTF